MAPSNSRMISSGKKSGVIDWQTILATIIQPHACASVGRALTDSLAQTHPPPPLLCRSIVKKVNRFSQTSRFFASASRHCSR
jgi:hypothetical protein